jgi:hypothetical protein
MVSTTNKLLSSLSPDHLKRVKYNFDDAERFNWNFVPIKRNGLTFYDFNESQKEILKSLLKSSLSEKGYTKATSIMYLENILKVVEQRKEDDHYRDPLNYHYTIFGDPDKLNPWAWRFEGHHLSLNFTCVKGEIISATPSFFGSNPGIVNDGNDKGMQVLKEETNLGFELVNSFTSVQLNTVLLSETAPTEIITGNKRKAVPLTPQGLSYKEMNPAQHKTFLQLLDVFVKNYAFGISKKLMDKIKNAGIDNLHFAWAGSLKPGVGHYYRIQGPMLLIEYDNTQNNANHVHTMIRDLNDDFAEDILREHYEKEHKN